MKYNGLIKKSRTFDALALLTILDTVFLAFLTSGTALVSPETYAIISIAGKGLLAVLRALTTGPVGQK